MRSSELLEALKKARMKTEVEPTNKIERPKTNGAAIKNKETESVSTKNQTNLGSEGISMAKVEKKNAKKTTNTIALNLDSGKLSLKRLIELSFVCFSNLNPFRLRF